MSLKQPLANDVSFTEVQVKRAPDRPKEAMSGLWRPLSLMLQHWMEVNARLPSSREAPGEAHEFQNALDLDRRLQGAAAASAAAAQADESEDKQALKGAEGATPAEKLLVQLQGSKRGGEVELQRAAGGWQAVGNGTNATAQQAGGVGDMNLHEVPFSSRGVYQPLAVRGGAITAEQLQLSSHEVRLLFLSLQQHGSNCPAAAVISCVGLCCLGGGR